jgi:hypothetical protein
LDVRFSLFQKQAKIAEHGVSRKQPLVFVQERDELCSKQWRRLGARIRCLVARCYINGENLAVRIFDPKGFHHLIVTLLAASYSLVRDCDDDGVINFRDNIRPTDLSLHADRE